MRFDPLNRAKEMMAAVAAALAISGAVEREAALHKIGGYRSRGKGRGTPSRNYLRPANNAGRHQPHQGAQERIRRRVGGFYAPPNHPAFTKAAMLAAVERGELVTYRDLMEFKYGN